MVLTNKNSLRVIHSNDNYKLCLNEKSRYKSLFLKRNVNRSKLSVISISRASKLFYMSKEELQKKIKENE